MSFRALKYDFSPTKVTAADAGRESQFRIRGHGLASGAVDFYH